MLPKNLKTLKSILEKKGFNARTSKENEVLKILTQMESEFNNLEKLAEESTEVKKSLNESGFTKYSFTGGNTDRCPCCGK